MNGAACETITSLLFGDGMATSGTCGDESTRHFTGKEHDDESNLDDFGGRYYSSQFGRFVSADWSDIPVAVPYADLTNPQTINLYAVVGGNPATFADLDGHMAPGQLGFSGGMGITARMRSANGNAYGCIDSGCDSYQTVWELTLQYGDGTSTIEFFDSEAQAKAAAAQQNTAGAQGAVQQQNGTAAQGANQAGGQQGLQNQQLKFKTVSGGQGTTWEVQFSLTHNTKIGGWIVQHIVADFAGAGHYDYWEAWSVSANSHVPSIYGTDANGASYSDMFAGGAGSHIHASARFYEGLTLPSSFKVQPAGFPAGILRTTITNPNLSTQNATAPNVRWWHD